MNFFCKRTLLFLLAISLVFSLPGCRIDNAEEKVSGIQIDEDTEYSGEVLNRAEQTIFSLVIYTYREAVMEKIPQKVEAKLARYAHRICEITAATPIPEEQYRSFIDLLEQDGKGVIDELLELPKDHRTSYNKTRIFYLNLTYIFGTECVVSMLYDFCVLIYDARYERTIERLETYQYPMYQEEAEELAAQKLIFVENVGKESFSTLVRCSTALAELLAVNSDGMFEIFSDAEMLEVIRRLDFSKIDIDEKGWELLLSYASRQDGDSYFAKLATAFENSGDLSCLAAVMNDALKLLTSVMENLLQEDITALRAGEKETVLNSIYSRFDDEDWALFASLTSVSLSNEQYSALAEEEYGKAYLEYVSGIEQVDLSLLCASVGTADFYQRLTNYLADICPAISYEVNS